MEIIMEKLTLKTKFTIKEFTEYNRKYIIKDALNIRGGLKIPIVVSLLAMFYLYISRIPYPIYYSSLLVFGIVIYFTLVFIDILISRLIDKRLLKYHSMFSKEKINAISKIGISSFYKGAEKFNKWDEFDIIYESKYLYGIYSLSGRMIFISKSAFKNEEELGFFKECTANIKKG